MFEGAGLLRIAYAANILILVPVVWSMIFSGSTIGVFEGKVADSEGLRLLVASLWLAILLASAAGLVLPAFFAPVLLIQIVYKAVWLAIYVWPAREAPGVPWAISTIFAVIVLTYPLLFWLSGVWRQAAS